MHLLPPTAGQRRRTIAAISLTSLVVGLSILLNQFATLLVIAGVVGLGLAVAAPMLYRHLPGIRIAPSPIATERETERLTRLRNRTLHPSGKADADYRAALRRASRWLYVMEGLLSQARGVGKLSEDAVEHEPADKPWGDDLYRQLGLPPEDEYR